MPSLLLHLTALERLALKTEKLPADFGRALGRDVEYARLGAALPELPLHDGFRAALRGFWKEPGSPAWYSRFHGPEAALFGVKMAELVAAGALVGQDAGRAFVAGYFSHLCLDRRLHPLVDRLAPSWDAKGAATPETLRESHGRVEWIQALFYVREVHGATLLGTQSLADRFRVQKRRGPPRGIGGGLYELVRVAAHETLVDAPARAEINRWLRGLYLHARLLASPLGRRFAGPAEDLELYRRFYRGPSVDVGEQVRLGLDEVGTVLTRVEGYMGRGMFTPRSRRRLLESLASACGADPSEKPTWSTDPHPVGRHRLHTDE